MTITQVYVMLLALQAVAVTVCWLAGSVPATLMLFLSIVFGAIATALIGGLIMVLA